MIQDYVPAARKVAERYSVVFDDGHHNGFSFPREKDGTLLPLNPAAKENYDFCMKSPERFARFNVVERERWSYTEPASGKCKCGNHIELVNEYLGACECPHCGQWYNLFGQELLPPNQWENC